MHEPIVYIAASQYQIYLEGLDLTLLFKSKLEAERKALFIEASYSHIIQKEMRSVKISDIQFQQKKGKRNKNKNANSGNFVDNNDLKNGAKPPVCECGCFGKLHALHITCIQCGKLQVGWVGLSLHDIGSVQVDGR